MRTPPIGTVVLIVAFVAVFVASRLGRAAGPVGIVLALVLVVVLLVLLRDWLVRMRRAAGDRADRPPRDVTPVEPRIGAPAAELRGGAPGPVVIVEAAEAPTDDLETRLQELARLRARGVLTDAEYEQKRAQLIADF